MNTTLGEYYSKKGIDIYNPNDTFYTDICYKYEEDGILTKSLPKKIASDLSQLEPLDVRYSVYVKKLFDEVFVEIEKLQKSKYIIETNEFIWAVKDYFDKKSKGLHY